MQQDRQVDVVVASIAWTENKTYNMKSKAADNEDNTEVPVLALHFYMIMLHLHLEL